MANSQQLAVKVTPEVLRLIDERCLNAALEEAIPIIREKFWWAAKITLEVLPDPTKVGAAVDATATAE
jgi:hypothetical protein